MYIVVVVVYPSGDSYHPSGYFSKNEKEKNIFMRKLNRDFGRISKVDVFTKSFFFLIGAAAKLANPCDVNYDALSPIF